MSGHEWVTEAPATLEAAPERRPDSGAARSLALGIAGILPLPVIASIPAIVAGRRALERIRSDPSLSGDERARAGIVLGWIGIWIGVVAVLLAGLALVLTTGVSESLLGGAGLPVAFLVGVVSFFSPCVLPLVPGYLSYVSGVSGRELESGARRQRVLAASLLFVLGFALVFTALGATASALGSFLVGNLRLFNRIAGAIVIIMGLIFLSGLAVRRFRAWAERESGPLSFAGRAGVRVAGFVLPERRLEARPRAGLAGAVPLGAAFAFGWTPCVGPGLATILTLAATEGSAAKGAVLLFAFSLGFGVPLVLGAVGFRKAIAASRALRRRMSVLTAVGGALLLAIGVLLVTDQWEELLAPLRRLIVRFTPPV